MQQDSINDLPLTNNNADKNSKSTNTFKVVAAVASIVALFGIMFGVYCVIQICQKNDQIANLKTESSNINTEANIPEPEEREPENNNEDVDISSITVENLYLIGDIYTKRRYYLGITDLDAEQDTRGKETYIIDTNRLGSKDGIKKYDLKNILNQAESNRVASLPDILAEGTTNATPKTDCQSYKIVAGDPVDWPSPVDWTIATDWNDKLPLTIYMSCMMENGGELSLGTGLYSLDPNTNELTQLTDKFY